MTLNKLASLIAKREGKKHQASIGDIREILKIISEIAAEQIHKLQAEGDYYTKPAIGKYFAAQTDELLKKMKEPKAKARGKGKR